MGYKLKNSVHLSTLANELQLQFMGLDVKIEGVSAIGGAKWADLTFGNVSEEGLSGVALIASPSSKLVNSHEFGCLISNNPRFDFIRALNYLCDFVGFITWNEAAIIHPTAILGENVVVESGCVVGENSIIEHNVVLHSGTRIGKNTRIRSCSSIGGDGFSFERAENGMPLRFPHLGGVLIGDNVEVGSCTAVAKGSLSDTIIANNVKIDNLVHIAHNCLIKEGAFVIACAEISGSVVVGENAWIAPNSCTHQKITIGDNSIVGLGAVVTKNVPDNCVYAGNPAKKIRDNM